MESRLNFSYQNRRAFLKEAKSKEFDLLVIGGGITGAGIALDAVTRGLSVGLIEKDDFASGTSGKSTKLIHGGLRYLKQFEFGLVKEVGVERAILHKLAPHLVLPEKMLLPLIKGGSLGKTMTSLGLYIYDFLADVEAEDKRRMLDVDETRALEPLLPADRLLGGSIYAEYRTDDARLTIEVIKSAYANGALPLSHVKGISLNEKDGQVIGVRCEDTNSSELFDIKAKFVVNAAGPWVDDVRRLCGPVQGKHLYLTKGSHIVVPKAKLPCRQAIYFDVPDDKRMIFAIPRLGVTYVGTTDTYYDGDKENMKVAKEDCDYLLAAVNRTFDQINLSRSDIVSSWSGIRPLIYEDGKSASEISRKDEIFEAENGLISIAGGKLTGYRKMAERIVDLVCTKEPINQWPQIGECRTDVLPLTARSYSNFDDVLTAISDVQKGMKGKTDDPFLATYLINNYGHAAEDILKEAIKADGDFESNLMETEINHCFNHEMIIEPTDFLIRRSGRCYFLPETVNKLKDVIFTYFGRLNGVSSAEISKFETSWNEQVSGMTQF